MTAARILIVDDCEINRLVLEELLSEDYATVSAESGEEAKSLAPDFKPDLVLLDVMMPGIDGYETCHWFRSHPELKATKVIMVSAKATSDDIDLGFAAGADEYITKPFDHRLIRETICKQLVRSSKLGA